MRTNKRPLILIIITLVLLMILNLKASDIEATLKNKLETYISK